MNLNYEIHSMTLEAEYLDNSSDCIPVDRQLVSSMPLRIFIPEFLYRERVCSTYLIAKR